MSINIRNNCKKTHKLDAERIITHILERIPEKFVADIREVRLVDSKTGELPGIKYVPQSHTSPFIAIEINMDHITLSGVPFFSILTLNAIFFFAINEHIRTYLKPRSEDREIVSYPSGRVNYNWMYLGIWNPVLMIFKGFNYVTSKIRIFHKIPRYFAERASQQHKKPPPE